MEANYRFLQVNPSLATKNGGPSIGALEIHRTLKKKNYDSTLIALNDTKDKTPALNALDNVIQFQGGWLRRHLSYLNLLLRIKEIDFVLIHGLHRFSSWGTGYVLQLKNIPYFVQLHGTLEQYELQHHRIRKKLFMVILGARFLEKSRSLIVASKSEADQAGKQVPGANVQVITLGANIGSIPSDEILLRLKDNFFETPVNKRLLFLGRLAKKKHPELVIEMIKYLPTHHLVLAGPEDHWKINELFADLSENDLSRISYVGLVDEAERKKLYELCSIFLLPSENENFGISIAEASLGGQYCITSDQVASSEHFEVIGNGSVCADLDVHEWVKQIRQFEKLDFSNQKRKAISSRARSVFSWEKFVERLIELTTSLK